MRGVLDHIEAVDSLRVDYVEIRRALYTQYGARVDELRTMLRNANSTRTHGKIERSVFSNLLQDIERHCLDAMMQTLAEHGYETCVKVYDGCMVIGTDGKPVPQQVLEACNANILEQTKIEMRCWEKCLLCGETLKGCGCGQ